MLKFSKKVEYALISLLHISELKETDDPMSSREIAEHFNIPPEILGKVMQALTREGLVQSTHGARGGYQLDRPLQAISIGDVMCAIDGPMQLTPCAGGDHNCPQESHCIIRSPVLQVQDMLMNVVSRISLEAFKTGGELPIPSESTHCICGVCSCSSQNQTAKI